MSKTAICLLFKWLSVLVGWSTCAVLSVPCMIMDLNEESVSWTWHVSVALFLTRFSVLSGLLVIKSKKQAKQESYKELLCTHLGKPSVSC